MGFCVARAWAIIASMYIGNVVLLILNLPLVGFWARIALIPFPILGPLIVVFSLIGAYSVRYLLFDVWGALEWLGDPYENVPALMMRGPRQLRFRKR